ncbi:peptidase MA family metallohydrolase [Haliangium sp.]|uniref:peptidase MA family metallohydrolase n=1 Tax=Haliangium sp. TaxID=2663208 RepID=UPI003D12F788
MTEHHRRRARGLPGAVIVAAPVALIVALASAGSAHAERGTRSRAAPLAGEFITAARMLRDWRYDEARELITALEQRVPDAAETRYLGAELAFVEGAYARTLDRLDGVADELAAGNVGTLRGLAASSLEVTKGFTSLRSAGGHFEIWYAPGPDEVIAELAGDVLESAYEVLGEDLGYRPAQPVRVELLGRPAELAQLSPLTESEIETTGTIALCKYNKLMVVSPRATLFGYPWMDTLVHEYVHYVVSRLSHDTVPVWLHEGLARFEQSRWRAPAEVSLSAMDEHLLATALAERRLIPLDDMHPSMAKLPSAEAAAQAFAQVFTLVGYLHQEAGYAGLRRVIELQRDGKSARRAVAEVLDAPWRRVERGWKGYLRRLDLSPRRALAGRAQGRRIHFDKGGESRENVGVDQVAGARAQRHARLGGMLRTRGMVEAAAVEYERAMDAVRSGGDELGDPFIAAKLSRTYLDLGRFQDAIDLAAPLAEADDTDAAPAVTLGLAYQATERPDEATRAFEAALRVSPFDPTVRCRLADLYHGAGRARLAQRERQACRRLQ